MPQEMGVKVVSGPEQPTLTEKIVELTHLPYAAGSIAIGLIVGSPGFLVISLLETMDPSKALDQSLANPFFSITQFGQRISVTQGLGESLLWTLFMILTIYYTRHMRLRILTAESSVSTLIPHSAEEKYHRAFGGIVSVRNALPFAAALLVLYLPPRITTPTGPYSYLTAIVLLPLDFLFVGIALWIYLRGLWGIYIFGKEDLNLRAFYEDRMLGLRPLGSISLSFSIVVFTLVVIALAGSVLSSDLSNLAVQFGLLGLLVIMLFLPLNGIHRKMLEAKKREQALVQARITELAEDPSDGGSGGELSALLDIKTLVTFRTLKEELSKIPTWPFDTGRLERFIAIFLSITAIIIARLIQIAFRF